MAFLAKFFPMRRTNALRGKIPNFQQSSLESIPEVWERLQEYIRACPHHGMEDWLVLQNFYEGLTAMSKGHVDAAAGGAFLSLTIKKLLPSSRRWCQIKAGEKEGKHKKARNLRRRLLCLPQK